MVEQTTYLPVEAIGLTEEGLEEIKTRGGEQRKDWEHFTPEFVSVHAQEVNVDEMVAQSVMVRGTYEKGRLSQPEECLKCKCSVALRFDLTQEMPYEQRIFLALTEVATRRQLIGCEDNCTLYGEFKRMRAKIIGTTE
jgi:hypothetical protein